MFQQVLFKIENKLIIILDFEKIVTDISPETGLKVSEIEDLGVRERNEAPVSLQKIHRFLVSLLQIL